MSTAESRFPQSVIATVVALSILPFLLWGFSYVTQTEVQFEASPIGLIYVPWALIHNILEWIAISVALCTVAFLICHNSIKHDRISPVIGTALFFSAMIDIFQLLAVDGLMTHVGQLDEFLGLTWVMSRTFYICLLIAGTLPFIRKPAPTSPRTQQRGSRFVVLVGILFVIMAYALVFLVNRAELPRIIYRSMSPDEMMRLHLKEVPMVLPSPRPYDLIPLVLFLFAGGIVFPRFYKMNPSLFARGLILGVVPNVAAQFHMAYGSEELYDSHFFAALFLKIVGYIVPLVGLMLDYTRAYRIEVAMRTTEEKLAVARRVQQGLLPKQAPHLRGFDLAGRSYQADVVGGDYFDFIPMRNNCLAIVVADVSGHEIGASILMAQTRAYLRALALEHDELSPIVTQVNRFLNEDVQNRWFVTLFAVKLDPGRGSFCYVAAGHECFLISRDGSSRTLESISPPLGVVEDKPINTSPEIELLEGDVLLLVTDGIAETASPQGEHFGIQRLVETVARNRTRPADDIVAAVRDAAKAFRSGAPQQDDLTVVVLKRLSSKEALQQAASNGLASAPH